MKNDFFSKNISELPLSTRAINNLKSLGINTINDFILLDNDYDFLSIPTVGNKTAKELSDFLYELKSSDTKLFSFKEKAITKKSFIFYINKYGIIVDDLNINELELPSKAYNFLKEINKTTVSSLSNYTESDFLKFPKIGKATVNCIYKELQKVIIRIELYCLENNLPNNNSSLIDEIIKLFSEITYLKYENDFWTLYFNNLFHINKESYNTYNVILILIANDNILIGIIKSYIIKQLNCNAEISLNYLYKKFKLIDPEQKVLNKIFDDLNQSKLIYIEDSIVKHRLPSIYDYLLNLPESKDKQIVLSRLEGNSYADIGVSLNLTREYIRQIVNKIMKNRPRSLYEDSFLKYFEKYAFNKEEFIKTFLVEPYIFSYLEVICEKNKKDKIIIDEDILSDEDIPVENRKNLEKIIYRDYIYLDNKYIKLSKQNIIEYLVKNFCKNKTNLSDIFEIYKMQIEDILNFTGKNLETDMRSLEGLLDRCPNVLKNIKRSYRYYNFEDYDFDELLRTLNLEQYNNIELSSLKFYNDYKELMDQYDIRDEYELHNLLKNLITDEKYNFKRMPTIIIGTPNRDEQILDLLLEFDQISVHDLALKYEERYGVKSINFNSYYNNFLASCNNDIFNTELKYISKEEKEYLETILVDDFYFLSDIKKWYLQRFPNSNVHKINSHSLLTLGFKLLSNYVIRKEYQNATTYFRKLLLTNDIIDTTRLKYNLNTIISFRFVLTQLQSEYKIIEFLPGQYINISKLNQVGITKNTLHDFCNKVYDFVSYNSYFTIHSIYKNGFEHELDNFGFSELFYANILSYNNSNFSHKRIGNTLIFKKDKGEISIESMIEYMLLENGKIDIYELLDVLNGHYGIQLKKDKLITIIKSSSLYYAPIMEAVYFDYETYFNDTFYN